MPYIGNPIYQSAFVTDQFSGDGTTVAYTMSVAPAGVSNVLVVVSGVLQDPSTYGVVGNTLTFSAAPPSGTGNISCRYLGVPVTGVVTTAYRTVTEFTATAGQTTFTPPSYTVGFISVYLNGVLLGSADYTATNGTTVVLATGASAGNLLTVESFLVSSVLNAIPNTAGSVGPSLLAGNAPQVTVYTSGSGTYTTPSYAKSLYIKMVGGGGGGECSDSAGGPAAGSTGGTTTFGTSLLTCVGGSGGSYNGTNAGGTATINSPAVGLGVAGSQGASPGIGYTATIPYLSGGSGGSSPFGGQGRGSWAGNSAGAAAANTGSGGGGGGTSGAVAAIPGGGGGSGGYIEAYITSPSATYSYAVGAGGAGAAAGTNGSPGGNGGSGVIIVTAYF